MEAGGCLYSQGGKLLFHRSIMVLRKIHGRDTGMKARFNLYAVAGELMRTPLERILDNLLNNATNAIPLKGGILAIRTYARDDMACVEVSNTGMISEAERLRLLEGEGRGRGLYITYRIVRLLRGRIDVRTGINSTAVTVKIPLHNP